MSLRIWNDLLDNYDHEQLANNWAKVDAHDHSPGRGVLIPTEGISEGAVTHSLLADNAVGNENIISGEITKDRLDPAFQTELSLQSCVVATEQSISPGDVYKLLSTHDEVTVKVGTNGLIAVAYQAMWKESSAGKARAAIHLDSGSGAKQLRISGGNASPETQAAATGGGGANTFRTLATGAAGLYSFTGNAYGEDATTGQIVGVGNSVAEGSANQMAASIGGAVATTTAELTGNCGYCLVFAEAGTYKITVQFKAEVGSVTAKNRKLWAWPVI